MGEILPRQDRTGDNMAERPTNALYDYYHPAHGAGWTDADYMDANPYGTPGGPTQRGAERDSMNLYNYGGQFWPRRKGALP